MALWFSNSRVKYSKSLLNRNFKMASKSLRQQRRRSGPCRSESQIGCCRNIVLQREHNSHRPNKRSKSTVFSSKSGQGGRARTMRKPDHHPRFKTAKQTKTKRTCKSLTSTAPASRGEQMPLRPRTYTKTSPRTLTMSEHLTSPRRADCTLFSTFLRTRRSFPASTSNEG